MLQQDIHIGVTSFVFYYPFFMSYLWIIGGLLHFFLFEKGRGLHETLLPREPLVAVVVPCYNEAANVAEVIAHLHTLRYPNYVVIAVNDGSHDDTGALLNELAATHPRLLVVHQRNEGKAIGLNTAAQLTDAEFLLCIDGDSLPDPDCITYMLSQMLNDKRIGAVTGNPRIRNRSTMLGRMQVGEFSSIIGLIKRTQQLYGRLMTVSGVMAMFRRRALQDVGYWRADMLTEDIDVSWRLQIGGWLVRFEPRALTWILMPETFRGLFRQRLRWAKGGLEVAMRYARDMAHPRQAMMWPIFLEFWLSVVWAYALTLLILLGLLGLVLPLPPAWTYDIVPRWHGTLLFLTCLTQLLVGILIDRKYDYRITRYFIDTVWYPVAFWILGLITTVIAVPQVVFKGARRQRARWISPDRGIEHEKSDH